ncbi:MAG: helix-turn-helix transcriptional regulator [Clostridia bacterium]|nr:helix-turn-helix transcriptional regulator [Clostridia bacterium]
MKINTFRINTLLAKQGLTQAELARRAGMTKQATCALIQRGTCEPRTAGKIASALNIDVEELIQKED